MRSADVSDGNPAFGGSYRSDDLCAIAGPSRAPTGRAALHWPISLRACLVTKASQAIKVDTVELTGSRLAFSAMGASQAIRVADS